MIFRRLGLLHKNQRGFTLIEMALAVAIAGIITSGITMTIFGVISGNARSSNHMLAVRQVQTAGFWISQDAQMAQSIDTTDNPGTTELELVTLSWTDYNGSPHTVTYTLVSSELRRDYDGQQLRVAEFIDPANTYCKFPVGGAFSLPDATDEFTITDSVGGDSGTITVTAGSISVTTTGTATYNAGVWTTPSVGDTVIVAATADSTTGRWTATTATAAITTDSDGDATVAGAFVLTVTAKLGSGSQEATETRVYEVIPRPDS